MVTQNHQIISSHELRKNGGKISRFWNQEIQELKENSENQNTEKSTSTWLNVWTSWAKNKNFKTNLLAYEAKKFDENKHMALDDWISQVVVYRGYYERSERVRYRVEHEKIKFISISEYVIFCLLYKHQWNTKSACFQRQKNTGKSKSTWVNVWTSCEHKNFESTLLANEAK